MGGDNGIEYQYHLTRWDTAWGWCPSYLIARIPKADEDVPNKLHQYQFSPGFIGIFVLVLVSCQPLFLHAICPCALPSNLIGGSNQQKPESPINLQDQGARWCTSYARGIRSISWTRKS
jgi:hypothetical protein